MDDGVWRGNIGMGREKGNRGNPGEIYKMVTRSELENARILVREDAKRDKMKTSAGRRAWNYEEKLRKGEGNDIARECLKEIKGRKQERGENVSGWGRGRGLVREQERKIGGEGEG